MVPVTAKSVTIKVHSHVEQIKELTLATHDGQPDVIKADKNVNYEFFDHSIGRAPNHIITKRKGKDLHVSFEREGQNDDLIIEGFFEDEDKALIGVAEDGHYYYYIPDTGEVADYVTQLQDTDVEGQALGGEHHLTPLWLMLPTGTFPWWPLLGLGVIPFLGKDDDKPAPAPDSVISTTNDSERGDGDNPVRVNVLKNDADNAVPETLRLINPETGRPTTEKVVVSGQGTWEIDPKEPGVVIFTPEEGYNGNPTPINYVVKNKEGKESQPTPVVIIYDAPTTPDTKPGTPGQPVTQNVTNNDGDVDPSTVKLVDPNNPNNPPSNEVKVPGQGTWTVGPNPGEVTFTPEDGFTGDPDPIKYVVKDKGGNDLPPTDVDVSYPQLTNPDTKPGTPGQPVTQNVTNNDGDVDPSTVKLVDPNNPNNPPSNEVKVPGQGTWTVGPNPGEVTFTPEDGFTGDPDPIKYVVKDKGGNDLPPTDVDVTYPNPIQPTPTNPDTKPGTPGQPVTQNVTNNDGDVDPSTVKLVDPNNPNNPPSNEVKVPGQGTWTVGPNPGEVTFTPEDGFTGDPDPIKYVVKDKGGNDLPPTDVDVSYPQLTNPDTKPGTPGQPVTQNVTNNDGDVDPSTVKLVDPKTGEPTDKIVVPNEGTWTVGPNPGEVTFTPEDGFTGNPGPINYYINDKSGNQLQPTPVAVTYPSKPVADVKAGEIGQPVSQKVTDNDTNVDPSTVRLVDPVSKEPVPVGTPIKVPGQGTWTQDPNDPSVVIFTPNPGFEQSPTPINYIVKDKSGLDLKPTPVAVTYPTITTPDTKPGTPGQPVTQNVTNNDGDVDPSTVKLVDPNNPNNPPSNEVKVPGQGTWTVGPNPGEVTFTPEDGFTGDPDPIKYVVKDKDGKDLPPTSVDVTYPPVDPANPNPIATTPDSKSGYRGEPVTQNVTDNDNNVKPDTVKLVDPITGHPTDKVVVPNEGTWTVGPNPGEVTFTPVPELGDKDPSPINYIVENDKEPGTFSKPTPVNITYPEIVKPKVSITGLTNVNEAVGEVEYTISLDKPAKEDITVTYVTKAGASTNPAEAADLKDGFVTKTVVIKAGETSATVKVGIVNDNEYEVAEDYNIAITKVEGNASIDAAKDNVTTTIHDDGTGTPDGRDPNNPDNINPNVPSDPAKPPFNPADPDNPDNNPDPRLPPANPVPDADNDGPAKVSITGLTNVNEAVGEVEYTISLDKPAKEDITVTYVTKAGASTNPAEAADLKDGFVTKTVVIKAGETSATVKVGIVNDNEYEVAEDYNIAITKVEGNASIDAAKDNVTTTIHDDGTGTPDGRDPNNPDNINPNVPSDPAKPPFNPADPDNPDNNPDPRLPPANPVPDADNDGPAKVSITGLTNVNEAVGEVEYTISLDKPAKEDITVTYVTKAGASTNPAEAADLKDGFVTKTVVIKAGETSATVKVGIVNDNEYEVAEDYNIAITKVEGNASIDAAKDNVTTTIHDDGTGTPDGRDPNNPDNINPNVPSDPAKPPFNPADPDNPDNNPDPRLPPANPVPDADNDGPAKVSITGLTNVNEAVGEVEYTISLDKPAKEDITVTYVTKAGASTNPAEAADLKDGFVTKTVVIKAGETSATVKVGIVNDNEYEVAEDYNIAITKVEGNASIDAAKDNVTTTIHDDGTGTPDGRDPNNPDNINPNVPSDPAKPPFNPADPDNPDNNPDPRLPPANPVPDADNDGPAKVSITGLTNVNEAVGEVEYTISLDKPAKEDITVTYVTKAGASTNPAEAADLKDGFVTKTVVIKAGETSATVKVGIVNDNEYEVAEDYNIAITKVEGNASIDAAKDNVTTTIHDDGTGTPDGRDPNNPDNINPNVPSDPAKPPFNPADPDNPDNNPDPRLPPANPVPDADNDGPAKVSITGLTNVNEAVGEVEYTISLDKPAKEDITVTYVTKAGASTNPAEAADLKDGFVTKTVVIKAGETSATVKVGIVNDNEYEVAEDYNIAITKVEGNASIDAAKDNVTTTIHDDGTGTPDGRDPNNPDNINPNVPSDPAKPPFNPADPDNPDNNPDPRLPPANPVPDADNDGPAKVSITGLTNVNEAVGEVEYTISLDKPAKEDITVTYVTKAGASTNPAEAADLKDGFVTKTVVIKAGETSATVKVGIVNDNEYEVAEDYNIAITKVEGNASIDAAKDNVTTTIHDDGTGTPDGRDPNNPDNINPNVPSDPAKPPFNPADPDNPDNNPDPRLPPANPVPDADNDGPAKVSITGLTNVNEAVGEVEYTISLDKPAKEDITVTYVTKAGASTNPAEAADLKDGFVTKTVVIKAGETSATVKVGIVNDNEYEVAEDYNIAITKVEGNASIDAAKDNVTTTIHDDGTGTPDGRDPNNPDNINPNVPSDPAKPPFNPADPDNPDNNPDPRLPPANPVPDADNDKPTVNLSGVRTVLESAGTAKYTFTLANGKTADKDVVIEYQVTVPANAVGINPAEAADFGNGTFGVTKTAIIKAGTSSVDINVPIINDEVYEGIETFVVNMTKVSDNASKGVDTVTTTINDFNGEVGVNKDKPVIELDPPAHVSEEGLPGGNKDNDPVGVDKTNATTSDGEIRIKNIDTSLSKNVTLALTEPTTIVTSGKQPVTWTTSDNGLTWIGRTPDDKPVLTIKLKEQIVKEDNTIAYKYTTELHAPIDHPDVTKEDNLDVNFGIVVKDGNTEIARDNKTVTVVEDDSPVSGVSIHNIDVPVDDVRLMDIVTGFSNPDSSNATDKRYFVTVNNDADAYDEIVRWGNPSENGQPRASYGIVEDASMINKKLDGFNIPFSLGTFNHDNQGVYVNKGLETVNMHVDFVVSINGEEQTVKTIFDLKHIETPNYDYDDVAVVDNLTYGITPDDFVIFKPQETTLLIGGKRYTLKLNQPEKVSGNGDLRDSVDNYDLLVKMEENYNTAGGSDDISGVNYLYNTGAANLIKTQLDGVTREDVVSGKVVIINTKEQANNGFKLSATLIPLDPNPEANDNLEHATNFRTGGDVVSDASLLDPNAQKVIWTLKDITDANKNIVDSDNNPSTFTFKTKYGTFIGNINGSYEFRGADNLAEVVDLGAEDRLEFGYTYQDNDGDSIQDTVVINFNDYAKETTGRTVNGTDDHDYIIGTTAADIIYGGKGDDTLIGELGADKLYGGEGNDKIVYDADDLVIDGGAGIDTLLLVSKPYKVGDEVKLDGNINLTNTIATGFEILDMNNGTAQSLTITAKDVLSINPEGRSLDVLGDGLDTVTLDGTFTKIDESTSEVKVGFDQYISNNGATLFISEEIKNIIM